MEDRPSAKLLFAENNHIMVRNFVDLVIHLCTGERFVLKDFAGWVELVTGSGERRSLHLLLSPKDTKRLVNGYVTATYTWMHQGKRLALVFSAGWLLSTLWHILP